MAAALPTEHPLKPRINAFDMLSSAATRFRYPTPAGRLPDPPDVMTIRKTPADLTILLGEAKAHVYGGNAAVSDH
jgi:hypothetical protein